MASYEERISELERKLTAAASVIQDQTEEIKALSNKVDSVSDFAYGLKFDDATEQFRIYLPYGSLTVNSKIAAIGDQIGWVNLGAGYGPIYVNIYRKDIDYYGELSREFDKDAVFYFLVGNIVNRNKIERFISGGVVLVLDEEVRGAFDVIRFNNEKYMYLPRNGTINYGGCNYTIKNAEAIGGWLKVQDGITYWCWASENSLYAYVTPKYEIPAENVRFSFEIGRVE